jgi:hypothetical protein
MLRSVKEGLLESLPRGFAERLFLVRNAESVMEAEVVEDVFVKMGISRRNRLWVKRLSMRFGHEYGLCRWLKENLRPDEVFYDIGSCYGFFPALVSSIQPGAKVHAFEANWRLCIHLRKNAERYRDRSEWAVTNKFVGEADDAQTVRLDSYSKANGMPSLIKCDVDGAEIHVLRGCREIIAARQTEFLLEVHPHELPKFGSSVEEILGFFKDNYVFRVLSQIREENVEWTDDLSVLDRDPNPYVYAAPAEIARFS